MSEKQWTISQGQAIRHTEGSLLVSAAAGGGKTAVLAERCAFLICDAQRTCDVDELLVATFTKAAAAEMRSRIHEALSARMTGAPEAQQRRLARQLALLEHAQVGTIHSFCIHLLKQNFSAAILDPQFKVIDGDEAKLLRRETARQLIDARYQNDGGGQFAALIDAYGDGREEPLVELICGAHEMLCSVPSPRKWCRDALDRLAGAAQSPLDESAFGKMLLQETRAALERLNRACAAAVATVKSLGGFEGYVAQLAECQATVGQWRKTLDQKEFDALVEQVRALEFAAAPRVKNDTPNKEQAKGLLDSIKEQMREGELAELVAFTLEDWRAGQEAVLPFGRLLLDLLEEFAGRYGQAKARLGGVDFADLESMALKLLRDEGGGPSAIARACHREFRYVLVDEYQDVNQVQDEILRLVSTECVIDEGAYPANLFTVGDVKQSIYRFRLAEPAQFLERDRRFRKGDRHGRVIDLQENFRSKPALLETINQFFKRLMTREAATIEYDAAHWLKAPGGATESGETRVELHLLPQLRDEADWKSADDGKADEEDLERIEREAVLCAGLIREMKLEQQFDYGDVAILLRSLQYKTAQFARILRQQGMPVHHAGGRGFFEAQEVRDVMALLSILDNQKQDIPLAAVLRSPLAALREPENVLVRVRVAYPDVPFHKAIVQYAGEQADETAAELRDLLGKFSAWRDFARRRALGDLVWHIYDQTEYLTFVTGMEDGSQRAANLLYLHQRARQFSSFLKQGLHRFMAFASELREELDLSQPPIAGEHEQAVRIMSIHAAKGLEFPVVIVPDLGKKHNLSDARGRVLLDRKMGLGLRVVDLERQIHYPSLSSMLISENVRRASLAEELRLLYVAMTRSKDRLILMGTVGASAAEKWKRQYGGLRGPLSTEAILAAGSMLDWLGPVQAACGEEVCKLVEHPAEDVRGWKAVKGQAGDAASLKDRVALKPLKPSPALTAEASAVISRLEFSYPHEKYVTLPAAGAATAMAAGHGFSSPAEVELPMPGFMAANARVGLSPTQIGDATHRVLEHLDYRRPCDLADVGSQIADLVARRFINEIEAAAVDAAAIVWLAASPLGKTLRANVDRLMREIPFAAAAATDSGDPLNAVMVRGRIDLLVPMEDGLAVVDYKTDRVDAAGMSARAESYRGQMEIYRDALGRVAGKKVKAVFLVFLHPRLVWEAKF
jgi:ATP-dependent helicase/nuclease subunit A